jgi:putative hemolysin
MDSSFFLLQTPLFPLIFLLGTGLLTAFSTSLLLLGRFKSKEQLSKKRTRFFFFQYFLRRFFPKTEWESLYFSISITKNILQFLYAASGFFYAFSFFSLEMHPFKESLLSLFLIVLCLLAVSLVFDYLLRTLATVWTRALFIPFSFLASLYLFVFFPLVAPFLKLLPLFSISRHKKESTQANPLMKDKIREMIGDSELGPHLDPYEQKLITSVIAFRERVAKEIMVPRIDVISLPSDTTLQEAADLFVQEGYSRIPIYKDTLDNIVGVLLYKDILKLLTGNEEKKHLLERPIELLAKPVIYAPENKKISQLLQEFRSRQIHLAIVVDEYGGTEGIVTIEDILEELVGEIEDEYDLNEDLQFWKLPNGNWIVDAKMSIIDIESKLGIHIPPHPEYETIGGYVFHRAGTIPSKGWTIQHDAFELEILSSSDRAIEKIRITPRHQEND